MALHNAFVLLLLLKLHLFNTKAVDTLLKHHADPSLSLTHGVGSALCSAVSFSAERRRKIVDRMRLVSFVLRDICGTSVRVKDIHSIKPILASLLHGYFF